MEKIIRSFLFRKLLTRHIWWWETHKKYPIRERVFDLPPLSVNPNPSSILAVLTTVNTLGDAAWAAQSLLRYLPSDMGLSIVVDGNLSSVKIEHFNTLFPGIILKKTYKILEELRSVAPNVVQLAKCHPLGRKLATILYMQQNYNLIYSDSDVLCFGEMPEIYQAVVNQEPAMYIQDVAELNADYALLKRVKTLGYDYALTLNSGLQYIPQQSLRVDIAEELLSTQEHDSTSWFTEQTILAVLMQQAKAKPLPKPRYVVSAQRQFYFEEDVCYYKIALRHFVGPVRHLMYSKGMPRLWQQWQEEKTTKK